MSKTKKLLVYFLLIAGTLVLLFPFWWMIVISLSTPGEASAGMGGIELFHWVPTDPQWDNYVKALKGLGGNLQETAESESRIGDPYAGDWRGFFDALANTIVITTLVIIGQILSCSLAGYAFARLRFRGRKVAFAVMLSTMMLPGQVTMIPMFLIFRNLGWVDTFLPLIVPAFLGSAFYIFMFRQFFAQIPEDLVDAGRIDGLSNFGLWWHIFLPMSKPVVAIVAIFTFIGTWNDFLNPLIYLQSPENRTLAIALSQLSFTGDFMGVDKVHLLMAASIATMIPCVILFFVAQRYFIEGLNIGGVKG